MLSHGDFIAYAAVKVGLVLAMLLLFRAHRSRLTARGVQGVAVGFCAVALLNTLGIVSA